MPANYKKIYLVFTRDFDQWLQEMIRNSLVKDVRRIWGRGLSDQIVHFTGRTFAWYRYQKEMDELKKYLISRPLTAAIFSPVNHAHFLQQVLRLKRLLAAKPAKLKSASQHLKKITWLFKMMYPYYPLGIFIAGPWREDFLARHRIKGEAVIRRLFRSREYSEGLLKEVGNYLRSWSSSLLARYHYPKEYARLLSVRELEDLIVRNQLPSLKELGARSRGYVYIHDRIISIANFNDFLKHHRLSDEALEQERHVHKYLTGAVAYPGKTISGRVQIILNSFEAKKFIKGRILVTPMTSPDYLPAMKAAKAIVTDEGGLTCHAAIVARELRKPCLIGTKIATKFFKDGDRVEVDAEKGLVRKL